MTSARPQPAAGTAALPGALRDLVRSGAPHTVSTEDDSWERGRPRPLGRRRRMPAAICLGSLLLLTACGDQPAPAAAAIAPTGRELYAMCQGCHKPDGSGIPGFTPALVGNPIVAGNPDAVITAILAGVATPGGPWQAPMPPFARQLNDADVATLTAWVRQSFAPGAAGPAPAAAEVARVRAGTGPVPATHDRLRTLAR